MDLTGRDTAGAPSSHGDDNIPEVPEQAENADIAPTVAWLRGLALHAEDLAHARRFDGCTLTEAFATFDTNPSADAPRRSRIAGAWPPYVAALFSSNAHPRR
ncbi:hypothetical protein S4A8_02460 [Salinisphaera sp. S4-8]|uniref:hypothetical protein n=1 Tax=Salinisphaera sp. S4-8 TaxID=633357 RepID=UPI00333FA937